jgi:hypothetical protein
MEGRIDIEGLDRIAIGSGDGEGYIVIDKGDGFRIGLVARAVQGGIAYSMEFLVRMMDREHAIDPVRIEQALMVTRALIGRGYSLTNEDDGWIYAERAVGPSMVDDEGRFLKGLVAGLPP